MNVDEADLIRPNAGRVYDYWLGGTSNFEIDRMLGDEIMEIEPSVAEMAHMNRAFLAKGVRYCISKGISQFLDLGSGIPTEGNVHEIARAATGGCRIVYVDIDPITVRHGLDLLADEPDVGIIQADLRDPDAVLNNPEVERLIDFNKPVCLLAASVLQYFPETEDLVSILSRYRTVLSRGSHFVLSHLTMDDSEVRMAELAEATRRATTAAHPRTKDEVRRLLAGWEPVAPGLVWASEWDPSGRKRDATSEHSGYYVAVGELSSP